MPRAEQAGREGAAGGQLRREWRGQDGATSALPLLRGFSAQLVLPAPAPPLFPPNQTRAGSKPNFRRTGLLLPAPQKAQPSASCPVVPGGCILTQLPGTGWRPPGPLAEETDLIQDLLPPTPPRGSDLWSQSGLIAWSAGGWSQRGQSAKCTRGPAVPRRPAGLLLLPAQQWVGGVRLGK